MNIWLRDCHIRLCLVLFTAGEAAFGPAFAATAEPERPSSEQDAAVGRQTDGEQNSEEYIGHQDMTRPRNQLDLWLQIPCEVDSGLISGRVWLLRHPSGADHANCS